MLMLNRSRYTEFLDGDEGITTNIPLHQEICSHGAFKGGGTDIHYLEKRLGL